MRPARQGTRSKAVPGPGFGFTGACSHISKRDAIAVSRFSREEATVEKRGIKVACTYARRRGVIPLKTAVAQRLFTHTQILFDELDQVRCVFDGYGLKMPLRS